MGTTYINTSAQIGNKYYYKVRAISASGLNGEFSDIVSVTCDLAKPVIEKASINDSGKPQVEWKKVDGASKYEVYSCLLYTSRCV